MHILLLPSWYPTKEKPLTGSFFREQALALHEAGVDVGVVVLDLISIRNFNPPALRRNYFQITIENDNGLRTLRFFGWSMTKIPKLGEMILLLQAEYAIKKYIKRYGKPDIIHAHSILFGGVSALKAKKKFGIPFLVTEHSTCFERGLVRPRYKILIRNTIEEAHKTLAVSRSLSKYLKHYSPGNKIHVVPNMVDHNFFCPPKTRRSTNPFVFLTVAYLVPKKGIDILILSFSEAFKDKDGVKLNIVGDGSQRKELENQVESLGLSNRINFYGLLSRDKVRKMMWNANVFVLPSLVETFGIVFIEAMSTGLPVIACKGGGPEEFVTKDVGILVAPRDHKLLSRAMLDMYENYKEWNIKENNIREYIKNNYSNNSITSKLIKMYREVNNN